MYWRVLVIIILQRTLKDWYAKVQWIYSAFYKRNTHVFITTCIYNTTSRQCQLRYLANSQKFTSRQLSYLHIYISICKEQKSLQAHNII